MQTFAVQIRLMKIIVKTLHGLEPVLVEELTALGATEIEVGSRAVSCEGDMRLLYRANLCLRTGLRLLVPILDAQCTNEEGLYNWAKTVDWEQYMSLDNTFAIDFTVHSEIFTHSQFAALKVKDAICDWFRDRHGKRPNVNTERPDIKFNLRISGATVNISLDSSGDSLHYRGYRVGKHEAPINEVLAAGMLLHAGYKGEGVFIDPFCGSGTLLIEAAMIASNTPANSLRYEFGFHRWKNFDEKLWNEVRLAAMRARKPIKATIGGTDNDAKSLAAAESNIERAGFANKITLKNISIQQFQPPVPPDDELLVVTNPPYGERLGGEAGAMNVFYKEVSDIFKKRFSGYNVWMISSNQSALKHFGLKPTVKMTLFNGKLECKYQKFEMW